jgi:hypothetical protein
MSTPPPPDALDAIFGTHTDVIRRAEIYNFDGTIWKEDTKLLGGTVSVDSSRDDRRNLSIIFNNDDNELQNHPDNFWYDKIIRPYRGIVYHRRLKAHNQVGTDQPFMWFRLGEHSGNRASFGTVSGVTASPLGTVTRSPESAWVGDIVDGSARFDGTGARLSVTMTNVQSYLTGVLSISFWWKSSKATAYTPLAQATTTANPNVNFNAGGVADRFRFQDGRGNTLDANVPGKRNSAWHHFVAVAGLTHNRIYIDGVLVAVGTVSNPNRSPTNTVLLIGAGGSSSASIDGLIDEVAYFNRELTPDRVKAQFEAGRGVFKTERATWEVPLGEFLIDAIDSQHFPNSISASGRDRMKGLGLSRFRVSTNFRAGQTIESLVRTIASNGGIPHAKINLPTTGITINRDFFFERHVSRSEALSEIGLAHNYDVFFDAFGFLRMERFNDPTTSSIVQTFKTGSEGNLVSYKKSSRDNRIFNVIVVSGESSDTEPVSAYATNTLPSSPTSIARIGERVDEYVSPLITGKTQAFWIANDRLKRAALEEFEVGMGSLVLPWLDAGTIVRFEDPDPAPGDPDRYLMTDLSIPLGLGQMDSTGKRVTIVGQPT